jgi:hypothetical protein
MGKMRALSGYSIIVVVLVVATFVLSPLDASPWLLSLVATALATVAAARFAEVLSVVVVGGLVAVLTVGLPLAMLFAIGRDSGLSPLTYFGIVDVAQALLPTLTAIVLLVLLKQWKRAQRMGS